MQGASRRNSYESEDGKEFSILSKEEVVDAGSKLKNKAPGDDNLPGELFKAGSTRLVEILHELTVRY